MNHNTNPRACQVARLLCVCGYEPSSCYIPVADREQVVEIVERLEGEVGQLKDEVDRSLVVPAKG